MDTAMTTLTIYDTNSKNSKTMWYDSVNEMYLEHGINLKQEELTNLSYYSVYNHDKFGVLTKNIEVVVFEEGELIKVLTVNKRQDLPEVSYNDIYTLIDIMITIRLDELLIKHIEHLNAINPTQPIVFNGDFELKRLFLFKDQFEINDRKNKQGVLDSIWRMLRPILKGVPDV